VKEWLASPPDIQASKKARARLIEEHIDVTAYVLSEVDAAVKGA
jgi:hypothetical protein